MDMRSGEYIIESMSGVEDTKGNSGDPGTLIATNLRITWISSKYSKTNISVGYNCVVNITIKSTTSRLKGSTQALFVLTRFNNTRFEFIFTNMGNNKPKLFTTLQLVHRTYERTKLYRDLKLRGSIVRDKQLLLLPQETIYHKVNAVWNLSSDQGNLGTFFITNIRLVWHANLAENFNVSIPFLQMKSIRVRDSKFGLALVVETLPADGNTGYVLGFKIDPAETLHEITKEIQNIYSVFSRDPIFGVVISPEDTADASAAKPAATDDVEIVESEDTDAFAVYYADVDKTNDKEVSFSPELGLAIEQLKEGVTINNLWSIAWN